MANCVFYLLLIALAEQVGFGYAYLAIMYFTRHVDWHGLRIGSGGTSFGPRASPEDAQVGV